MKTSDLYSSKEQCCGCEACSYNCPMHIITMQPDDEGFLYPLIVDDSNCINCKQCINVCPVKNPGRSYMSISECYGGYVRNELDLKRSASGGYATAISQKFLEAGGVVYGVKYSEDFKEAVYSRATNKEELEAFRTSKYAQPRINSVYSKVLFDLRKGYRVLFIGVPCEISALYHIVNRNAGNLYTVSLICHGPTSPKVHADFCNGLEAKYQSALNSFSLRYKKNGWKPYYIKAGFKNGKTYQKPFVNTAYGIAFQYLKRPSCSVCKYKTLNVDFGLVSDITLGDYHSVRNNSPHYNLWGVSQACIQSEKGKYLINLILPNNVVVEIPKEKIMQTNIAFHKPIQAKKRRVKFVKAFSSHSLWYACFSPWIYLPYKIRQIEKRLKWYLVVIKHFFINMKK